MRRILAFFLLLALTAPSLPAQQAAEAGERMHTVQSGETLSTIAQRYYGDAEAWDRIHQANVERIEDPARIFVGQVLRIPGIAAEEVVRFTQQTNAEGEVTLRTPRSLLQARSFEPQPYSPPPGSVRTIFYPDPEEDRAGSGIIRGEQRELRNIPPEAVRSAGWVLPTGEVLTAVGRIDGFVGESRIDARRNTAQPYEELRVVLEGGAMPRVGDRLLTVRVTHAVRALETVSFRERATGIAREVGRVVHPTGIVTVRRVDAGGFIAEISREFDRVQLDDRVMPLPAADFPADARPAPTTQAWEARMLDLQKRSELPQRGDVLFLDRGRNDGLAIGDELEAVVRGAEGFDDRVVGRVQVVGVRDQTASARILEVESPVFRPGVRLRLSGKMP